MSDTQPATNLPRRLPKPIRVSFLVFSVTLATVFVLFSAAVVVMPSTKSSRIDWQAQHAEQAAAAAEEPQTTQPAAP
jgi:hypothetical protein